MSARRLPVYLLLDTSGSMRGEPIESVNIGLQAMISSLRQNPYALESVHLAIITFDSAIKLLLPLTALEQLRLPPVQCPESGATLLGEGLEFVCRQVDQDLRKSTDAHKGDWRPLLFIMTDGKPSDTMAYSEIIPEVKRRQFATIIACAAGPKADAGALKRLTDTVVSLDTMDSTSFAGFFQWVSAAVTSGSASMGAAPNLSLPPPPSEVNVVL